MLSCSYLIFFLRARLSAAEPSADSWCVSVSAAGFINATTTLGHWRRVCVSASFLQMRPTGREEGLWHPQSAFKFHLGAKKHKRSIRSLRRKANVPLPSVRKAGAGSAPRSSMHRQLNKYQCQAWRLANVCMCWIYMYRLPFRLEGPACPQLPKRRANRGKKTPAFSWKWLHIVGLLRLSSSFTAWPSHREGLEDAWSGLSWRGVHNITTRQIN